MAKKIIVRIFNSIMMTVNFIMGFLGLVTAGVYLFGEGSYTRMEYILMGYGMLLISNLLVDFVVKKIKEW